MSKSSSIRFLIASLLIVALSLGQKTDARSEDHSDATLYVSLIHLIVFPELVNARKVGVVGFLSGDSPPMLFLTRDHAESGDFLSAVPLFGTDLGEIDCINMFVRVIGKFGKLRADDYGIIDVEKIQLARGDSLFSSCWPRK